MRGKKKYEYNLKKIYDLVFSYFSKEFQNRIETHPAYPSTIQDNSIELLRNTKVIIHDPERTKYAYT